MKEYSIEERLAICKRCPLYSVQGKCNSSLWMNPNTNDVSTYAKIGYKRGCGCFINIKTKNPHSHCGLGKW